MSQTSDAAQLVELEPPKLAIGRPKELTPKVQETLIDLIRAGRNVEDVCETVGIDDCTFYRWQADVPDFSDAVARARVVSAHAYADRAASVAQAAFDEPGERGEKARGAAVAAACFQWQAERRAPAVYGQRSAVAIDARVTHEAGETVLSMGEIVARRAAARAAQGGNGGGAQV